MLPIGSYKGSGISMMMDIFGGVISGAAFAGDVGDQYKAYDRPQDVGHFFLAMKPDLFVSEEDYRARMDTLVERVRAVPKAQGFDEILIPGEPEARLEAEHRKTGIPYSPHDLAPLHDRSGEGRRAAAAGLRSPARLRNAQMQVEGYDIDIVVQGFPGKTVCHGGLGWSTVVLIRGRGKVAMIDTGNFNVRSAAHRRAEEARAQARRPDRSPAHPCALGPLRELDAVSQGAHRHRRA